MSEGSSSEINVDIDALPRSVDLVRGPDGAAAFITWTSGFLARAV